MYGGRWDDVDGPGGIKLQRLELENLICFTLDIDSSEG